MYLLDFFIFEISMFVNFKYIKFKNILSYGNQLTEVNFEKGLNLIKAPNGSGKSTMLDAINYALFDKPFRNIKKENLINRINGKNLYVEFAFSINKDDYIIERGMKPDILKIKKNDKDIDLMSSKKLVQEEVEKFIGINQKMFKNVVGIAVTNNKPFLSMTAAEKRNLIENIFNIDMLGSMMKEVKKRKSINDAEQRIKVEEYNSKEALKNDNEKYLENMNNYIKNFNSIKQTDIDKCKAKIKTLTERIEVNESNIKKGIKKLEELQVTLENEPDQKVFAKIIKEIGVAEADKNRLQKQLDQLEENAICPICGTSLTGEHALEHKKEVKETLDNLVYNKIPELKKVEEDYTALKEKYDKNVNLINKIKVKLEEENRIKDNNTSDLIEATKKLEEINKQECPFIKDEYEVKITNLKNQMIELQTRLSEIKETVAIDKELIKILGDDGIKVYFFRKLIPLFNQNINEYLKKFDMPITIEFNDNMEERIYNTKKEIEYDQFSGGEKTRIDMSILLSFFNVSRIISNWSCSLLFIDEVLDSQVDDKGLEQFIATLYNMINSDNSNKLGIYIVSHKLGTTDIPLNSVVKINKSGIFSQLEVKK